MDKSPTSILETIMNEEIKAVSNSPAQVVTYNYKITLHTPNMDVPALMVSSVNLLRDYYTRFGDVISLQASFPLGEVIHEILPNHTELEITIIKIPLHTSSNYNVVEEKGNTVTRYTAKLYDMKNSLIEGKALQAQSRSEASKGDMMALDFQLISPILENLRVKTFGTVIRDVKPITAIKTVLMYSCPDAEGVTVEPGYLDSEQKHIVIPHLTRVVDMPKRVDKTVGGLYPTGFRYYMQYQMWYIYSPYNVDYFHTAERTMTIINLPRNKLAEMEVTFRLTPTQLILLGTGDSTHFDQSETALQNLGNGFRYVDSSAVLEAFGNIELNKLKIVKAANVVEATVGAAARKVNNAPEVQKRVSQSYNLEYAEVMRRAGSILQVQWEGSEVEYIMPGMPIRYMYMDSGFAKEIYGRILSTETKTRQTNHSVTQRIFTNDTVLTIFVANSGNPK